MRSVNGLLPGLLFLIGLCDAQINLQNLAPLLGLLGSLKGGGGGLGSLLGGGAGGGLSGLLGGSSGGLGALSGLTGGGGGSSNALAGLLSGAGNGGSGLAGLLGGGGGNQLAGLLGGGGGGNQLAGLLGNNGGGAQGSNQLAGILSALQGSGIGGGNLGGGGGGVDASVLSALLSNNRGGGIGGGNSLGGNSLAGLSQGNGYGGLQDFRSNLGGYSGQGGFSSGNDLLSSGSGRDDQILQMLSGNRGQSPRFGGDRQRGGPDNRIMDSLLNGNDDDPMTMLGSKLRPSIVPDIAREQGSLELSSRESKACFVDGYKGSCMPISLQGICKLYNYEIQDGGCVNFQTMSRDICCFRRDPAALIDSLRKPPLQRPLGPEMLASSSNVQESGPSGVSNPGLQNFPLSSNQGGSSLNGNTFSNQQLQTPVNPIANTLGNVVSSQMQSGTDKNVPPSIIQMILNALQAPKSTNPADMATNIIDGLLSSQVPTEPPPVAVSSAATLNTSNFNSLTSQITPEMLPALQSAVAGMQRCNVAGSPGLCVPVTVQSVCQSMKLKILAQGCGATKICCAQSSEGTIPDDLVNSVRTVVGKSPRATRPDDDPMLAQGSENAEARIYSPQGRSRKSCTSSGFEGICVATSLTSLCPGLGMQVTSEGCEPSESCCYASESAASNIDPSLLKDEPLGISFDKLVASNPSERSGSLSASPGFQAAASNFNPSPPISPPNAKPVVAPAAQGNSASLPATAIGSPLNGVDFGGIVKAVLPMFLGQNRNNNLNNNNQLVSTASTLPGAGTMGAGSCGGRGEAASCVPVNMAQSCSKMGYQIRMGGCPDNQLCCYTPTDYLGRETSFSLEQANKCMVQEHVGVCLPAMAARNCSAYGLEVSLYGCRSPDLSCCYTRNSVNGECGIKGKGSASPGFGGYGYSGSGMPFPVADSTASDPDFADVGEYCWQAALLDRSTGNYFCSAVLIDTIWLLTSAHCITKRSPMDITVRLGEWDFNVSTAVPGPRDYSVFNLYIHSGFNSKTLENDIAMLKLNRPADIGLSNICLACRPGQIDYYGMNCQAGGWGKLGQNFPFSSRLKRIPTRIWPNQECVYRLKNSPLGPGFRFHTTSFMCGSATGRQTICNGDGGGPLVCNVGGNYQLAGIVVSGIQCGQGGMPALFVNLGQYQAWIDEVMKN